MVIGENGIFSKANDAKKQTEIAEGKEKIELEYIDLCVNKAENEEKIPTYDEWITALETKKIINEYDGETQKINGQVSTISVPTLSENEYPVVQIKNKKYKFYIRIEDGKAVYIDEDPDASGDESYNNEIGTTEKISYSGNYQEYVVEDTGYYKIECWGASGQDYSSYKGGRGAYTSGIIKLNKNDKLYIYAGGQGSGGTGGYNGGANSGAGAGGGATDIRLISGATNNIESLKSRIMVAGAGGGAAYNSYGNGGAAGGLVGREGSPDSRLDIETYKAATGGTQTAGGSKSDFGPGWGSDTDGKEDGKFGLGGKSSTGSGWQGGAGGAGYYGGGGGASGYCYAGAGGSSFISGHDGCRAIDFTASTSSIVHKADSVFKYNNKEYKFIKTTMIDGEGYAWTTDKGNLQQMPKPAGGNYETGEGHSGNGYAKITFYGNNANKLDNIEEYIEEQSIKKLNTITEKVTKYDNSYDVEYFKQLQNTDINKETFRNTNNIEKKQEDEVVSYTVAQSDFTNVDYTWLKLTTVVIANKDFSMNMTEYSDDGASVYLNNEFVGKSASCSSFNATYNFKRGANILEIYLNEGAGGCYTKFDKLFNSNENIVGISSLSSFVQQMYPKTSTKPTISIQGEDLEINVITKSSVPIKNIKVVMPNLKENMYINCDIDINKNQLSEKIKLKAGGTNKIIVTDWLGNVTEKEIVTGDSLLFITDVKGSFCYRSRHGVQLDTEEVEELLFNGDTNEGGNYKGLFFWRK